ncbi:probable flavin-containing monoamine oxidase A [Electrophorus electricus]|uniref:probable flavin-containing monoamine oxidase A n=1 Tax=Electrophorus electricus TaxID=8005 RepID=UPI0015CFE89F|nr:probable flavin-containing monoamine oxidase A [Electrophorus electricus]
MSEESCDVVVVGAGLSGFSAAHLLKKRQEQWKVLVLEGKGRVGGRTLTQHLPAAHGEDMWDMGGQWVSSSQTHVMELIRELGLEVSRQFTEGKKIHHMGGANAKIRTYTSSIPSFSFLALLDFIQFLWKIERLCKTVSVEDPMTTPNAQQLDSMTLQSFMDRNIWTTELIEEIGLCSRSVFGVEPSQLSFLYFLMYSTSAGGIMRLLESTPGSAQEFKVKGGTQQLSERLAEQVGKHSVRLGSAVTAIWQNEDHVEVKTATSTINCKAVIVTCPPHMAAKIYYKPALPMERQHLTQCMPVGHMTKFIITYPTAFWKRKGFSGEIVARPSEDCPFGVTFDATSHQGSAALVGFIAGAQGSSWNSRELVERKDAVIASLVKYLGLEAASYIHYEEKDWSKEEYSGGCPVNVMVPGMLTYYHAGLRKPCGRIYWAGTETATQWCGYLSGAVQAGQRAAVEVLAAECPSVLSESELQKVRADMNRAPQALQHLTGVSSHRASHFRLFLYLAVMVLTVGSVLWLVPEYGQY